MESTVAQNTHISNDFSHLSGVATVGAKALPLAFPTPEQESATLAPFRREVSQNYKVVMDICAYVDAPDDVRNLIDALISLSNGNVQVSANDYQIGAAFFNNEANRNRLKKKVQRWRSNLDKWQKASGVTLVQIRSGFRRTVYRGTVPQEQNVPSEYRIIVLDMAAKVLAKGDSDTASAIASVVDEMGGLASRVDEPRNHKRTPESLGRTAATWLRKSLEAARADAYPMSYFIRDLKDDLAEVFAEFGCGGEPITARQSPDGEPYLTSVRDKELLFDLNVQ